MADPTIESLTADLESARTALEAMTAERDSLKTDLAGAKSGDPKIARELKAANKEIANLKRDLESTTTELTEARTQLGEATTKGVLGEYGISDGDDQDYVLHRYGKVAADEDGEKPTLGEWLKDQRRAKAAWLTKLTKAAPAAKATEEKPEPKADPKADPKVDEPKADAKADPKTEAKADPKEPAKSPDAAASKTLVSTKQAGGQLTATDIAAMDTAQYKAHRARIRQELGLQAPS